MVPGGRRPIFVRKREAARISSMKSKARAIDDIDGWGDRMGDVDDATPAGVALREERLQTPPYMQPLQRLRKLQLLSNSRINSFQSSSDGKKRKGIT